MDKTLIAVRKQSTDHGSYPVEGDRNANGYVIVDDFMATGNTADTIMEKIAEHIPHAKCVAILQAYYFDHEDFSNYHGWPEVLCTSYAENWNARRAIQDKEKAQRELKQREDVIRIQEEQIAMVSKSEAPRYEWDCNKENSWTPMTNWERYYSVSGYSNSLTRDGLPAPKPYTGLSRRNQLAAEVKRREKLEQDRTNFNVRMYGQQRKPQLSLAQQGVSK
jgi:hypothetical protein